MEIRRTGSNNLKAKTKVVTGMVDRASRTVSAERNGQKGLGPARKKQPVLDGALETCGENAGAGMANRNGNPVGGGEHSAFIAIEAKPNIFPINVL